MYTLIDVIAARRLWQLLWYGMVVPDFYEANLVFVFRLRSNGEYVTHIRNPKLILPIKHATEIQSGWRCKALDWRTHCSP